MSVSISVIVPTYNSEKFIEDCLDSILMQDFDSFEVLVSDDKSTDSTREVLKKYGEVSNLKVFYQDVNLGITRNCNFLLEQSKGRYICFFAGDDVMLPGKLRKQFKFMEQNVSYSFCYHQAEIFNTYSGRTILNTDQKSKHVIQDVDTLISAMGVPASMSIMARKTMLPKGFFNNKFKYVSDWLIQIELALNGQIGFISEVLCKYRKYNENNGKDLNSYEDEFMSVLDHVSKKYPELKSACSNGKSRYLIGKSFRVDGPPERRSILKHSVKLNVTLINTVLLFISYIPFSNNAFLFIYKHRYSLKKIL